MEASHIEPFMPLDDEFVVKGRSGVSVLKNSTLDPFLRNCDVNTLFLLGFATHVCVESTLREAHDLSFNACVVHDGCAEFETTQHDHVRRHVIHHFGDKVSVSDLIEKMEE
ncbi:MAG: cysteine hydrolase family protein [Desulforhopalus sp.]